MACKDQACTCCTRSAGCERLLVPPCSTACTTYNRHYKARYHQACRTFASAMTDEAPKQLPTPRAQKVCHVLSPQQSLLSCSLVPVCIERRTIAGQACSVPNAGDTRQRQEHQEGARSYQGVKHYLPRCTTRCYFFSSQPHQKRFQLSAWHMHLAACVPFRCSRLFRHP